MAGPTGERLRWILLKTLEFSFLLGHTCVLLLAVSGVIIFRKF